jgi:PPOX class probable F420-dependent enzyme
MVKPASEDPTKFPPRTPAEDLTRAPDSNQVGLAAERNIGALATIKLDGRPHLSTINFTLNPATAIARISVIDDRVIVNNMRRDPRVSIYVASVDGWTYAVLEGTVEMSPVALAPDDDTVEELVEIFRAIRGEDHPDWDDFRVAMVAERRLVVRLRVETAYGLTGPDYAISA